MKKQLLNLTMLLIVLLMGGVKAVAADTEYTEFLNLNFETADSYTKDWTTAGTISQKSISDSKYLHLYNGASASYSFPTSISKVSEYILEFDANVAQCNGYKTSGTFLKINSATGCIFQADKTNVGWSSNFNISANGNNLNKEELVGDGYVKESNFTFMYHYKLVGTSEGVKLTVTNKKDNTTVIDAVELSSTIVIPTGISLSAPKNASAAGIDNIVVQVYSEDEVVPNPVASITAVNLKSRTITLVLGENSTDGSIIKYYTKDDKSDLTTYSEPIVVTENTTIHYYTVSAKGNNSEELTFNVDCSEITLNTPYYTKQKYDNGVSTVILSTDVNSILLNPAAKIHYEMSDNSSGEIDNGGTITVKDGVTVKGYATADGYNNSNEFSFTAVPPYTYTTVFTEQYNGRESQDRLGLSLSDETVIDGYYNIFYKIDDEKKSVSERILINAVTANDLFRPNGLYLGAGHTFALLDVKKGDYVTIKGAYGNGNFNITSTSNGENDGWNTVEGSTYCFNILEDGVFKFNMGRYGYLQSITIQHATTTLPLSASDKLSTYTPTSDVDLTNEDGVKFYAATVNGNKVTLTQVEGAVKAGTGLLVENNNAVTSVTLALAADGNEVEYNHLVGVTEDMDAAALVKDNAYILISDNIFQKVGANATDKLAKGKAYLSVPSTEAQARQIFISNPTAVNAVAEKAEQAESMIYNMQGMRVKNADASGLYIVNGKKYIKK